MKRPEHAVANFFAHLATREALSARAQKQLTREWRALWPVITQQDRLHRDTFTATILPHLHRTVRGLLWPLLNKQGVMPFQGLLIPPLWFLKNHVLQESWQANVGPTTESHPFTADTGPGGLLLGSLVSLMRQRPFPFGRCPHCDTIFARVGRQRYCSRACAVRAFEAGRKTTRREYMRDYMAKIRAKAKRRQSRER